MRPRAGRLHTKTGSRRKINAVKQYGGAMARQVKHKMGRDVIEAIKFEKLRENGVYLLYFDASGMAHP
jgi:hypothetical protein